MTYTKTKTLDEIAYQTGREYVQLLIDHDSAEVMTPIDIHSQALPGIPAGDYTWLEKNHPGAEELSRDYWRGVNAVIEENS